MIQLLAKGKARSVLMKTTIELPEAVYSEVVANAQRHRETVEEYVLRAIREKLADEPGRFEQPIQDEAFSASQDP
jgi:hypothetical protein